MKKDNCKFLEFLLEENKLEIYQVYHGQSTYFTIYSYERHKYLIVK